MKIYEVHTTFTNLSGTAFHATFKSKFSDSNEPLTNLRNEAIKALSDKFPDYWHDRQTLEVYLFDQNGVEVMLHSVKK